MRVLITGARGYIGAHTIRQLKQYGHTVIATDLPDITANDISAYVDHFFVWDIRQPLPSSVSRYREVDALIHYAARIAVEESVAQPTLYYQTNLFGTINVISNFTASKMIFASTGTAFQPLSPYARSKLAAEEVVRERCASYTIFRFYNVAGSSGFHCFNEPTHLMRRAALAARGDILQMAIYGTDYETKDGTCVRDYVHVEDIATAVCRAVTEPAAMSDYECLGSNQGYTVREVIETMQRISGKSFKVIEEKRRAGDPAILAVPVLSPFMRPQYSLADMCQGALAYL